MANQGQQRSWSKPTLRAVRIISLAVALLGVIAATLSFRRLPWLTVVALVGFVALLFASAGKYSKWLMPTIWQILLALALVMYLGSLGYQAGNSETRTRCLAWARLPLSNTPAPNTSAPFLVITYPRMLPLEAPDQPGCPLSAYVWPSELVITPTPTATQPPTTQATTPLTVTPSPTTIPVTPSSSLAVSPTQTVSYTVAFAPYNDGLLFTDEKGVPVAPKLQVKPDQPSDKPAVLFLHRALTSTVPVSVLLTAYLYDSNGIQQKYTSFEVKLEDTYSAWWRHLGGIVLGPTTPLLALAAALVGFGWQWWQEGQKRRQTALEKINEIEILANRDETEDAKAKLEEVAVRYGREPGVQDDLRKARLVVCRARIRRLGIWASTGPKDVSLREEESLRQEIEREARKDREFKIVLEELDAAKEAIGKRTRAPWPKLWPRERPPDAPAIDEWRKQAGLEFNPFGPERAEEDPHLLEFIVEPSGWERIKAPRPTLIVGVDGSGRTASRLFLAHTCTTTKLTDSRANGRPFDTLPVSFFVFPEGNATEVAAVCWRALTCAMAQAHLDFLARNPGVFSETPPDQQRALARLLTMHRHSLGDPAGCLLGAGLDKPIALHVGDSIRKTARGARSSSFADEAGLLSILAQARLLSFQQSYVLVEIPDQVYRWSSPEKIVSHLNTLLHIAPSLAARGIYFKLFISAKVRARLEPLPSCVDEIEISWDEVALRKMLEQRVQQAGAPAFRSLFGRVPSGFDPTTSLIQAASASEGSPRRLIQLGQALLAEHICQNPGDPRLRWKELDAVLRRTARGETS